VGGRYIEVRVASLCPKHGSFHRGCDLVIWISCETRDRDNGGPVEGYSGGLVLRVIRAGMVVGMVLIAVSWPRWVSAWSGYDFDKWFMSQGLLDQRMRNQC
jgi:hypothetical protein